MNFELYIKYCVKIVNRVTIANDVDLPSDVKM